MNVTRDVILDLLPVYLAGEATADTAALVNEFAQTDTEIAERLRLGAGDPLAVRSIGLPLETPDLELRALGRTRRWLAWQRYLFGLGCFFTALSCSAVIHTKDGRITGGHMLILDLPLQLGSVLALGLGSFAAYFWLRSRLNTKGALRRR